MSFSRAMICFLIVGLVSSNVLFPQWTTGPCKVTRVSNTTSPCHQGGCGPVVTTNEISVCQGKINPCFQGSGPDKTLQAVTTMNIYPPMYPLGNCGGGWVYCLPDMTIPPINFNPQVPHC